MRAIEQITYLHRLLKKLVKMVLIWSLRVGVFAGTAHKPLSTVGGQSGTRASPGPLPLHYFACTTETKTEAFIYTLQ